jgi:hypothetical protein
MRISGDGVHVLQFLLNWNYRINDEAIAFWGWQDRETSAGLLPAKSPSWVLIRSPFDKACPELAEGLRANDPC